MYPTNAFIFPFLQIICRLNLCHCNFIDYYYFLFNVLFHFISLGSFGFLSFFTILKMYVFIYLLAYVFAVNARFFPLCL